MNQRPRPKVRDEQKTRQVNCSSNKTWLRTNPISVVKEEKEEEEEKEERVFSSVYELIIIRAFSSSLPSFPPSHVVLRLCGASEPFKEAFRPSGV